MIKQSFIIYNDNGDIIMQGNENLEFVQERIDSGENVLLTEGFTHIENYKVDVATKEIVQRGSNEPVDPLIQHVTL